MGALVALGVVGAMLVPTGAQSQPAGTVYEVQVGQEFFSAGIKAFSARVYPGSLKVHSGDTIHFSDMLALFPAGVYPQDYVPENIISVEGQYSFLQRDPDEGPRAVKINQNDPSTQCGRTQTDPCVWGQNEEPIFPAGPLDGDPDPDNYNVWVTVDAPPGTVLWGDTIAGSEINTNVKVEVVGQNEAASTQEELDARAAQLLRKDYEDTLALYNKLRAKRTWHINAAGQKVFDVWTGGVGGPIEFFDFFPRKITVPRGARVQYHFQDEIEPHTVTFGGRRARRISEDQFLEFACDPDGDEGTAPDTAAEFGEQGPMCPEGSTMELDVNPKVVEEAGDGRVTGPRDYENSGLKMPIFPEETEYDSNPWTVRMTQRSTDRGFKYICIVHGADFMFGRVVVK